jgi:class 3 adenylate cyclase
LLDDLSTSFSYFSKALSIFEEIGSESSKSGVLMSLAALYQKPEFSDHNVERAEELLVSALALAQHSGNNRHTIQAYDALAQLCRAQDRWEESLEYFLQLREAEKELFAEETRRNSELLDHRRQIEDAERNRQIRLARFQEQEKIFHKILPEIIADRLIEGEKVIADAFANVSIFFSDIVGFTTLSSVVSAKELVHGLNDIFTQFDALAKQHNVEKIKTIGDAYMAVCGAPTSVEHHANHMSEFALSVQELVDRGLSIAGHTISIRIGLHCGDVVAGVIGEDKFAYDLWGDAVNTASRMESHGEPGRVHCSEDFVRAIHGSAFRFAERGEIAIKGKGSMKTYFLERIQQR